MIQVPTSAVLGSSGGITASRLLASGDPLARINFIARFQNCKGFGPAPQAPLAYWQDTAATVPATADGTLIAAMTDVLSGSGLKASNGTGGQQPTLNIVSGFPVATYAGGQNLQIPSSLALNGTTGYTIFTVSMVPAINTMGVVDKGRTTAWSIFYEASHTAIQYWHANSGLIGPTVLPNTWYVVTARWDGTTQSLYINGTLAASQTNLVVPVGTTPVSFGQLNDGFPLTGQQAAPFLMVGSALDDTQRSQVETFLATLIP
jgi:hypothetical protein